MVRSSARAANDVCLGAAAVLVVLGWVLLAVIHPNGPDWYGQLGVALVVGTMFGHAALAAIWCALGPLPFVHRLPLSGLWLATVVLAFGINLSRESGGDSLMTLAVFGGALLLEWLIIQAPLWIIAKRAGLRLAHQNDTLRHQTGQDHQFRIREIMILTALVAIVLGAGRMLLGGLRSEGLTGPNAAGRIASFLLLALANAAFALLATGAAFVARQRWAAALAVLVAVVVGALVEVHLFAFIAGMPASYDEYGVFIGLNVVQYLWILVVLNVLRGADYGLIRGERESRADPKR